MERTANIACVMAGAMWAGTVLLILAGAVVGHAGKDEHMPWVLTLMALGLALSAAAATVSIRAMFIHQNRLLKNAFALGQDSAGSGVRRMH